VLGQIFRIGTVHYGPVIAHCTDSKDFPVLELNYVEFAINLN